MTAKRSLILGTTVRLVFDAALVLSVYLLFAGHNQPGGGFVGGLVAAGAIALYYIAGGIEEVRSLIRIRPWKFLSLGLGVAVTSALLPLLSGAAPLDHTVLERRLPILGELKVTTAAVFDAGVYLIVVGLVLMIFEGLGEDSVRTVDPAGIEDAEEKP